ncbi:FkbM family methyltransferase [Sphingomonas profundi]|uniref:FkbM family methyltransferase n=1 Tax=Alterirhizorhabdus profundi TaxID=2681549 RepID=UPI0012E7D846|nr:FkbM family methyltransferase [Sphingomonas profundi]
MLNLELGTPQDKDGRSSILTSKGKSGHAVYGPYEQHQPGEYAVQFNIEMIDVVSGLRDQRCAVLDVTTDSGNRVLARKEVYASQLRHGRTSFAVRFRMDAVARVEYRIWVSGRATLILDDHRPVVAIEEAAAALELLASTAFPEDEAAETVPFFAAHKATLRGLYENGVGVRIHREAVVLTTGGVSFYARQLDDLNFVGEVLHERVYDFSLDGPISMIDVGMNIGLSSLLFAAKPGVVEVHSFEPFRSTFERASDNLTLNPACAAKIQAWNYGLSDRNYDDTILVAQDADSGAMSTVAAQQGIPIHVTLRDAAEVLGPILAAARERGVRVVAKVDCEGSEFAIFETLERHGLLGQFAAFMVEWHVLYENKSQRDLIAPLERAGFMVFDRSPRVGNGFFYAVRVADA